MLHLSKNSFLKRAFPTPKYLTLDPVAIDITPFSIRIMKLKLTKFGFAPSLYREVKLKKSCDLSDEVTNDEKEQLVSVLRKLKLEYNLKYATVSLPEQRNYIFQTTLPIGAKSDIASAVRYSLQEYVPFDAVDLNFDYYIIDENKTTEVDVVVSVFPKNIVQLYTEILNVAGIIPMSFLSESTSMSNSLVDFYDKNPYLIIRLMKDRFNIVIVENSIVQYTSTINVNIDEFSKTFEGQSATELKESLNKLLIFWFTNKQGSGEHKKIENVILTGEYATTEGVLEFFEKNLKIHTEVGNVWKNAFSFDDYIPKISRERSMNCAVVVGLALGVVGRK